MGNEYKIERVEVRGQWSFQGQMMQDYGIWLENEVDEIKLTQKPETAPPVKGDVLFGIIESKRSPMGAYRKFKKIKPEFAGLTRTVAPQPNQSVESKLDRIILMLEELLKRDLVDQDDPFKGKL